MRGSSNGKLENREALLPFPKVHFQYKIITKLIFVCSLTQTRYILFKPMTPISFLCYALFLLYSNWKTSKTYALHTLDGPQWYNKIGISFDLSIGFISHALQYSILNDNIASPMCKNVFYDVKQYHQRNSKITTFISTFDTL